MSSFYVKRAGKLYGPFSFEQVTGGINRGIFSAQDMISVDRITWEPVEEFRKKGKFFAQPAAPAGKDTIAFRKTNEPAPDAVVSSRENENAAPRPAVVTIAPPATATAATGEPRLVDRLGIVLRIANILGYILLGLVGVLFILNLFVDIVRLADATDATVNSSFVNSAMEFFNHIVYNTIYQYFNAIFLCVLGAFNVFGMLAFYLAWQTIPREEARTTPEKAVGFWLIPFFSLYWAFVAFYGLAADVNQQARKAGERDYSSEGGMMMCCILYCFFSTLLYVFTLLLSIFVLVNYFSSEHFPGMIAFCFLIISASEFIVILLSIFLITRPALAAWRLARDRNAAEG